jgi:LysM repeat protein
MKYIVPAWEAMNGLDALSMRFDVTEDQLIQANPILSAVPVYPGIILEIPVQKSADLPGEGYLEYVVQPDDTFYNIAGRFKLEVGKLMAQNSHISNPYVIWPGQIIYLRYLDD